MNILSKTFILAWKLNQKRKINFFNGSLKILDNQIKQKIIMTKYLILISAVEYNAEFKHFYWIKVLFDLYDSYIKKHFSLKNLNLTLVLID
jgi:hypothetical protein